MKKCFGYVRVSTMKQGEGVSLEAQREAIEQFAARNDIMIVKWFEERVTAAKSGRPEFNQMLQLLKRRRADGVVMHKIDRSARNFADWAKIGDLSDAGIDVHFATETLDFRSRGGRLSADIQAVIAADYIRNLREEIKKGIYGRLQQGFYPFGAPIGYLDQGGGKAKAADPVRAPLIRMAFEFYATGNYSLRSLLVELTRRGLRNGNGRPVTKSGLETILGNPFYCGLIRIQRTGAIYQGVHEPLISARLFTDVQDIKSKKAVKKDTRHLHRYRGLFRCRYCRSLVTPERQKGHVYYRCRGRECPTNCVREEAVENAVAAMLAELTLSERDAQWLVTRFEAWWNGRRHESPVANARMQLGRINSRLERLTEAMLDRLLDDEAFNNQKEKLLLERLQIEDALRNAAVPSNDIYRMRQFCELMKSLCSIYISSDFEEKRQMVQLTTANRAVDGKNVVVEPAIWLSEAHVALHVLCGGAERSTTRRLPDTSDQQIDRLREILHSPECQDAMSKLDRFLPVSSSPQVSFRRRLKEDQRPDSGLIT